ncbi:MAG: ribosome assembly factor SBDS [Candidatus Aenigmarchaeota archaeon]|nr:ribosome assembly factor SBDS [Candidatus Aenigmarchaeota archaeon]
MPVSVEKAVIARITKAGQRFELLVDPMKAMEVRSGKTVPIEELLAAPEVFENVGKSTRASPATLNKVFGTNDIATIARIIIREGEVQLTTEQRRAMTEERTKAVAAAISRQGVDPRTGAPHPAERILRAMEQAKVHIDPEKPAEQQIEAVLKAIAPIIPIKFERATIAVKIPAEYAPRVAGIIRNFGTPSREEWAGDGSYMAVLEMPAGLQTELYDKLNALTKGSAQVKLIKREGI